MLSRPTGIRCERTDPLGAESLGKFPLIRQGHVPTGFDQCRCNHGPACPNRGAPEICAVTYNLRAGQEKRVKSRNRRA
ncbi:hypothetical protein RGUI_1348 [Rhodovulum sp. P5]|nr:hypothetical protein RGUI_1348 [Rhodovulum sp. P5]